ncbi:UNVERIFIED_CONTAM: hypothetical protein K2H54_035265, partial [Gekko kuhli]
MDTEGFLQETEQWFALEESRYHEVKEQFGGEQSTVAEMVTEVCLALGLDLLLEMVCLGESVGM